MSYLDRGDPEHPDFKRAPERLICVVCTYCEHTPGQRCPECGVLWV